jgi:acyl-CoA thioester hydrolase
MQELDAGGRAAPLRLHTDEVRAEWLDYNGHMNLAYFIVVFDRATDKFLDLLDIGESYRFRTERSLYTAELHATYHRELMEGETVAVTTRAMGADAKRLHVFHELHLVAPRAERRAHAGELAATNELMMLHVDMKAGRAVPFEREAAERLRRLVEAHARLPRPAQAGRAIAMSKGGR